MGEHEGVFKDRAGHPFFATVTLLQEATLNMPVSSHRSTQSAFFRKVLGRFSSCTEGIYSPFPPLEGELLL